MTLDQSLALYRRLIRFFDEHPNDNVATLFPDGQLWADKWAGLSPRARFFNRYLVRSHLAKLEHKAWKRKQKLEKDKVCPPGNSIPVKEVSLPAPQPSSALFDDPKPTEDSLMRDRDVNVAANLTAILDEQSQSLARAARELGEVGFGQPVTNRVSNAIVTLSQVVAQLARYEVLAPPTPDELKAQYLLSRIDRILESETSDHYRIDAIAKDMSIFGAHRLKMNGAAR